MSHPAATRDRARELYVQEGWTFKRISDETGVAKTTLLRWSNREGWDEERRLSSEVRLRSRDLLLKTINAARESTDPQAVYAVAQAERFLDRLSGPASHPAPKMVAIVLLDQLGKHPVIGPVVKRYRNEVIRIVLEEVKRLEPGDGSP